MKYNITPNEFELKSIKDLAPELRPREKIRNTGPDGLSDLELFCCILGSGGRDKKVQDLASEILFAISTSKNLSNVDLRKIHGLGEAKASIISACLEIGRRFSGLRQKKCDSPEDVYNLIRHYGDRNQEHFLTILFNGALEVIGVNVVTVGLVNKTLVHPREVFADAIKKRSTSIVIAHNHPSGFLEPSAADLDLTKTLIAAGKIIGIKILDHIIFDSEKYVSLAQNGIKFD